MKIGRRAGDASEGDVNAVGGSAGHEAEDEHVKHYQRSWLFRWLQNPTPVLIFKTGEPTFNARKKRAPTPTNDLVECLIQEHFLAVEFAALEYYLASGPAPRDLRIGEIPKRALL